MSLIIIFIMKIIGMKMKSMINLYYGTEYKFVNYHIKLNPQILMIL